MTSAIISGIIMLVFIFAKPVPYQGRFTPEAQEILNIVNEERLKHGLSPLKLNRKLCFMATDKAVDMRDKHYFDHTSPTYGSPFQMMNDYGIYFTAAGENIAAGYYNCKHVMNGWMNSSGHRANILNGSFTELGVGYVTGGSYGTYWVQEFIRPSAKQSSGVIYKK
ncbi:MAG: hypothetical protein IKQ31_05385 [Clostridia bacterium]|nr:hypothetical protein [Clostridia bacterium]